MWKIENNLFLLFAEQKGKENWFADIFGGFGPNIPLRIFFSEMYFPR